MKRSGWYSSSPAWCSNGPKAVRAAVDPADKSHVVTAGAQGQPHAGSNRSAACW
jgi:hypothetical protein